MNDGKYRTIHECERNGIRCTVLHNSTTGGVITTEIPLPRVPVYPLTGKLWCTASSNCRHYPVNPVEGIDY